jgi:hypothetical protein
MAKTYIFTKDYTVKRCVEYNSLSVCLKEETATVAKKGTIITGDYYFDTRTNTAGIKTTINGTNYNISPSYLKEKTASTPGTSSGTNTTEAAQTSQETWFKKYVTKTNVIIGLSLLAVTLIILKIFKVF